MISPLWDNTLGLSRTRWCEEQTLKLQVEIIIYIYYYYYAEAANSGQNHTVKHNTAHSSQIKKGTYIHSN